MKKMGLALDPKLANVVNKVQELAPAIGDAIKKPDMANIAAAGNALIDKLVPKDFQEAAHGAIDVA